MKRGLKNQIEIKIGIYKIEPTKGKIVETYCDSERHGGGWTLVLKSASNTKWTKENAGDMNSKDKSLETIRYPRGTFLRPSLS